MPFDYTRLASLVVIAAIGAALLSLGPAVGRAQVPIVQPGAPGEPSREISASEATDLAGIRFTDGDVKFMQGMIPHHAQALEMTALVAERTASEAMRRLAQRIELSQEDEIEMMQAWLDERGQAVTEVDAHHADGWEPMPGMLTPDEMAQLAAATGNAFDRLFLERMIEHHRGAVTMVENLLEQRGAAQDSQLFAFTSDVTSDQTAEIDRMDAMLAGLSPDPRVGLAAGFEDAGQAASNMALVATRAKPAGFFDPRRPAGRRVPVEPNPEPEAGDAEPEQAAEQEEEQEEEEDPQRRGLLSFGITDLAFAGDRLFVGSYHGFNTYGIETPASPRLIGLIGRASCRERV